MLGRGLVAVLVLLVACSAQPPEPVPSVSAEPDLSASAEPEPSGSMLPGLRLPGMNLDEPAGEYGWTGDLGSRGGMHKVVETASGYRETQLVFAVEEDCFALATDAEAVPVTVAGFEGEYVEPYPSGPSVTFHRSDVAVTTGAYGLAIGDRTLCVYLTWDPDTTPDELSAAREVVESIRAHPGGGNGIRTNFTLPAGWDTG